MATAGSPCLLTSFAATDVPVSDAWALKSFKLDSLVCDISLSDVLNLKKLFKLFMEAWGTCDEIFCPKFHIYKT